ncbi:unnamed protein product [Symbiodinium sp. CCMP2592]|nr:unnamed protein product [Symbiodinium sp. CCMP2592]
MLHDGGSVGGSGGHESQEAPPGAEEECCQREAARRFQTPRAAKCWAMYCAFLANPGVKCPSFLDHLGFACGICGQHFDISVVLQYLDMNRRRRSKQTVWDV